ncbi:MAG: hypothetical protein ACYS1A_15775 [Planctomycetota bacterium]|jgi:hypothetical protein
MDNEHRPHQGIENRIPFEYNKPDRQQGVGMPPNLSVGNIARKDSFDITGIPIVYVYNI